MKLFFLRLFILLCFFCVQACSKKPQPSSYLNLNNDISITLSKSSDDYIPGDYEGIIDGIGYKTFYSYKHVVEVINNYAKFKNLNLTVDKGYYDKFIRYTPESHIAHINYLKSKYRLDSGDFFTLKDINNNIVNFVFLGIATTWNINNRSAVELFTISYDEIATNKIIKDIENRKIIGQKYSEKQAKIRLQEKNSLQHVNIINNILLNKTLSYFNLDKEIPNINNYKMKIYNLDAECYPYCKSYLELYNSDEKFLVAIKVRLDKDMFLDTIKLSPILASKHRTSDNFYVMWNEVLNPPISYSDFWR